MYCLSQSQWDVKKRGIVSELTDHQAKKFGELTWTNLFNPRYGLGLATFNRNQKQVSSGAKGRPACKDDNLTAVCEFDEYSVNAPLALHKFKGPRHLWLASGVGPTACRALEESSDSPVDKPLVKSQYHQSSCGRGVPGVRGGSLGVRENNIDNGGNHQKRELK
jgi:hypothetical protein